MPTTKKNHGHENDSSRKGMGEDEKSKGGKSTNERGRNETSKSGETNSNREGNQGNR